MSASAAQVAADAAAAAALSAPRAVKEDLGLHGLPDGMGAQLVADKVREKVASGVLRLCEMATTLKQTPTSRDCFEACNDVADSEFLDLLRRRKPGLQAWEARAFMGLMAAWCLLGIGRSASHDVVVAILRAQHADLAHLVPTLADAQMLLGFGRMDQPAEPSDIFGRIADRERREQVRSCAWGLTVGMFRSAGEIQRMYAGRTPANEVVDAVSTGDSLSNGGILSKDELERIQNQIPKRSPMLQKWFNQTQGKRLRTDKAIDHTLLFLGRAEIRRGVNKGRAKVLQGTCAFCGGQATYRCRSCKVALHRTARSGQCNERTCYERFHMGEQIDESSKKRKTSDPVPEASEPGLV